MSKNATYTSSSTQNEILEVTSKVIINKIVENASNSYISVIADESTDCTGKVQLSIVLRYLANSTIKECFIGFVELSGCNAQTISTTIISYMRKIGLNLGNLVGQGYDGLQRWQGTLVGSKPGLENFIQKHCTYIAHCML